MSNAAPDPEDFFWKQIEEQPGNPLPRLVFADWCDENDFPTMADLQRWLAATNRRPLVLDGEATWLSFEYHLEGSPLLGYALHAVPYNLAVEIRCPNRGRAASGWYLYRFPSLRSAEEALAEAWTRSVRWRQFFWRFKPNSDRQPDAKVCTLPTLSERVRKVGRYGGFQVVLLNWMLLLGFGMVAWRILYAGETAVMIASVLALVFLIGFLSAIARRRTWYSDPPSRSGP